MGGYFSTRWTWEQTRADTDGLLRLDVRHMQRTGVFRPGALATWQWTRDDGEPCGTIQTVMNQPGDCMTLDYATRRDGETGWTSRKEAVWLDTTPCNYGGHRVWFRCSGCQSRRAVLFHAGSLFRCRVCHDLAYSSTRETYTDRSIRRCAALQKRLGGGGNGAPVWEIPPKPPRMHWRTYRRLVWELRIANARRDAVLDVHFEALTRRSEALLARAKGKS